MPQHHPVDTRETTAIRTGPRERREPVPEVSKAPAALRHIAIIPDGNRRWAVAQGLPLWDGVRQGVKTAEATFEAIRRRHIPWCTFWASSYDNLTERPAPERVVLNELFASWFSRLAENATIHRERVRVRVIGEWRELLIASAVSAIDRVLDATALYEGPALTFLIGYDGDRELAAAVNNLLRTEDRKREAGENVILEDLRKRSWTNDLPDVDLIVRTGSWEDPHRSANFLPLMTSNVQEAYPKVFWPSFSESELDGTIADFARRGRRKGR